MTWTLETKTQDVAPAKRGDEWRTLTTYHVKDDRGRHVTCISAPSGHELLRAYQLDERECAEAARLIAAAPALRDALETLLAEVDITSKQRGWSGNGARVMARAALALLDAPASVEVEA